MQQQIIINEVLEETEKRIKAELIIIQKDIADFENPVTSDNLKEKIDGRLSTKNLTKNYERKLQLEKQIEALINFKYVYFKEYERQ